MTLPQNSIETRHLSKRFGATLALDDVTLSVRRGEIVGFLGPNGAGKSTTLRIFCGLIRATAGEAWIDGIPVAREPAQARRRIGYMAENNPLPEDLRVTEYLAFRGRLKGLSGRHLRQRVETVLEACDLRRKYARHLIGSLSKGLRQRVGIADAIIAEPPITIMDEPTIGLDPHQVLKIRNLIDALRGQTTVLISSHILSEIEISCDRAIILNRGRVVAAGTTEELHREFLGHAQYHLRINADPTKATALLRQLDAKMRVQLSSGSDEDGFYGVVAETSRPDDLCEELIHLFAAQPAMRLREIQRQRPRLEDVFLRATRRSWEEASAVPVVNRTEEAAIDGEEER